eukprot:5130452-Pleurochrysis_carterae.AAC.1
MRLTRPRFLGLCATRCTSTVSATRCRLLCLPLSHDPGMVRTCSSAVHPARVTQWSAAPPRRNLSRSTETPA